MGLTWNVSPLHAFLGRKIYFNTLIKIGGFLYYYKEKLAEKMYRKLEQFLQIYLSNEKIILKAIKSEREKKRERERTDGN